MPIGLFYFNEYFDRNWELGRLWQRKIKENKSRVKHL